MHPGNNTNLLVHVVWDPFTNSGEDGKAVGKELLSQYISGRLFKSSSLHLLTCQVTTRHSPSNATMARSLPNPRSEIFFPTSPSLSLHPASLVPRTRTMAMTTPTAVTTTTISDPTSSAKLPCTSSLLLHNLSSPPPSALPRCTLPTSTQLRSTKGIKQEKYSPISPLRSRQAFLHHRGSRSSGALIVWDMRPSRRR